MKRITSVWLFAFWATSTSAQSDTSKTLREIVIRPYFSEQTLQRSTGSISLIDSTALSRQPSSSLVSAMNTLPGIRMDERSPGSYRLSIRGSLLRSPFGVRNVKIYLDEFPLTDAGGNSYLNAIDAAAISGIQILKGPQSSVYGANSGGVILVDPGNNSEGPSVSIEAGSFGLFRQSAGYSLTSDRYKLRLTQAYQRSDGYRDHSAMERKYIQALHEFRYSTDAVLKVFAFYSDLEYQTPGGLTAQQFTLNPRASRPATGTTPGAAEQKAGIYSRTFYGGVSNNWLINKDLRYLISVYGSHTDFKNPFITNFETRKEQSLGLRTYLEYTRELSEVTINANLGIEGTRTRSDVDNYDNYGGLRGPQQSADDLTAHSNFAFAQVSFDLHNKVLVELSTSLNLFNYHFQTLMPTPSGREKISFDKQIMPRLAVSYRRNDNLTLRASASRGYSPPTLAEVRASNQLVNTGLEAEHGWNTEGGINYRSANRKLEIDLNYFFYQLRAAIVRRVDAADTEYFINSGGTRQEGLETSMSLWLLPPRSSGLLRSLQVQNSWTLSHFRFRGYLNAGNDYSGNMLTGVPKTVSSASADLVLSGQYSLFLQHLYTSSIPLNDANTIFGAKYHLVQAKAAKTFRAGYTPIVLYVGADNLLNQHYSLGNDLNAFGGRYFNAAAKRNFYAGLSVKL
ncbi:TonB-dependent receptor [Pedobacter faecalis]|uniref:TonB-dependent receptor n=1 Tax=Pedobacter faecalis TaxID=3041495 RepID=UPI00254F19F7|nr:TonB-dependent receptor [Pedobacter sp. ELA7]